LKNNKKLNDGCLKIFQFLKLLYENNADYDSVVNIFQEDIKETNTNTIQVILNKYINTLKIFGIKIKKENNKYQLLSSLYSMNFTIDDLKAISILTSSLNNFPDIDLTQDVNNFIQSLETRMNNDDKNKLNDLNKNIPIDNSFYYTNLKEQIKQCEQLCKDNHTLTILYKKRKKELSCKGTPKEVIYDSKDAYLKIYDSNTHHNLEIPISNILSIAIVVLMSIIAILAIIYFKMSSDEKNASKSKSKDSSEETVVKEKVAKRYTKESIFNFMEFEKIEDNMIIQKKRKKIFNGYGVSRNKL
jgi:predicted DNA-binding transcriptional regulator YafY